MDAPATITRRHPDDVRDAVNRSAISKADLATRAQVHVNTLADLDSPDWNPKWRTLDKLCAAAEAIKAERS